MNNFLKNEPTQLLNFQTSTNIMVSNITAKQSISTLPYYEVTFSKNNKIIIKLSGFKN